MWNDWCEERKRHSQFQKLEISIHLWRSCLHKQLWPETLRTCRTRHLTKQRLYMVVYGGGSITLQPQLLEPAGLHQASATSPGTPRIFKNVFPNLWKNWMPSSVSSERWNPWASMSDILWWFCFLNWIEWNLNAASNLWNPSKNPFWLATNHGKFCALEKPSWSCLIVKASAIKRASFRKTHRWCRLGSNGWIVKPTKVVVICEDIWSHVIRLNIHSTECSITRSSLAFNPTSQGIATTSSPEHDSCNEHCASVLPWITWTGPQISEVNKF